MSNDEDRINQRESLYRYAVRSGLHFNDSTIQRLNLPKPVVILIMATDAPIIEVNNLVREFGDRAVLDDVSFNVHRGETLVIMGGSGCGKSTLLRHMIGSMKPTSGTVKLFGEEITGMEEREIERVRLRFGMLFQSGALLASLTVGENVALPLLQHTNKTVDEIEEIVEKKLQMVGLTGFKDLKPDEISGGMKKRVGLARALALDPELLFSDEPTSGLDPIMTAVVDKLTQNLTKSSHMTAVVVSHDMTSAFRIATRMIMLGHGSIVAQGTPDEIRNSTNPEVQQFINGRPDGPIPLNLSQEEHKDLQHVRPRPFRGARFRFHLKHS
jgi:phospholipid/cholesterol/gamma-HCH transport system ATP-binding protein